MLAFQKEDQSKSQNNNILNFQYMFVFNLLLSLLKKQNKKKTVNINDNRSLLSPQTPQNRPRVLMCHDTKQAILSKMGDFLAILLLQLENGFSSFYYIFTSLEIMYEYFDKRTSKMLTFKGGVTVSSVTF